MAAKTTGEGQVILDETNGEKMVRESEKSILQRLKEGKQVSIHIPNDPLNDDDNSVIVGVCGVFWPIERGKEVMVPEPVALIWNDSYKRTREAEKRMNSTDTEVK